MDKKMSFWQRLKARKLDSQFIIAILVLILFVISFALYWMPFSRNSEVVSELIIALFTSLLVSEFTILVDITVEFIKNKNETYLEDLREFGIGSLYTDKGKALQEALADCDGQIWVSGYRLILTYNIRNEIYEGLMRGASIKLLICPPWSEGFRLVYGENEKVINNYYEILNLINKARKNMQETDKRKNDTYYEVHFINKPLFSDTYRVDQKIITGPYLHNKDEEYNRIMAKDFFSYNIERESRLYKLVENEYLTLCDEAEEELDWDIFEKSYIEMKESDLNEKEKIELFRKACVSKDKS